MVATRGEAKPVEETTELGATVREGEHNFGVAHIFAFNDTFIHSRTDLTEVLSAIQNIQSRASTANPATSFTLGLNITST